MKYKIALLIFLIELLLMSASSQNPEDRCTQQGQKVCENCQMVGLCDEISSGVYTITHESECSLDDGDFCDDTLDVPTGTCFRINPTETSCGCNGTACFKDPNNENWYIPCGGADYTENGEPIFCSSEYILMDTCECSDDPLRSTTKHHTTVELPTTKLPTISELPTVFSTCPEDCPYVKDPDDDCEKYFYCFNGHYFENECQESSCFDQTSCGCVETTVTSSSTTTSDSLTCPPGCDYVDDPDDDCQTYYRCRNGENYPRECPTFWCFDQELCACTHVQLAQDLLISPDDCPFVDDPNDDCGKYFYCADGQNFEYQCPESLCFDQSTCSCIDTSKSRIQSLQDVPL